MNFQVAESQPMENAVQVVDVNQNNGQMVPMSSDDMAKQIQENVGFRTGMDIHCDGRSFDMKTSKLVKLSDGDLEAAFSKYGSNFIKSMKSIRALLKIDESSVTKDTASVAAGDCAFNTQEISHFDILVNAPQSGKIICRVVHITKQFNLKKWATYGVAGALAFCSYYYWRKESQAQQNLHMHKRVTNGILYGGAGSKNN